MEKLAEESELHRNFLLPPLPIQQASQQYEANFRATMGIVGSEVKMALFLGGDALLIDKFLHTCYSYLVVTST